MPRFGIRAARDVWWFFLIVLVGHTGLVSFNILRDSQNDSLVNHSLQVSYEINRLLSACIDIETEVRGFVITGDPAFVESFERAKARIPNLARHLRELTADNAAQQASLDRFDRLIDRRQGLLQRLLNERQHPEPDMPAVGALVRESKGVTEDIRDVLNTMQAEEQRLLQERETSTRATFTTSILTTIIGGILTIGMLILTQYLMKREFDTRRRGGLHCA